MCWLELKNFYDCGVSLIRKKVYIEELYVATKILIIEIHKPSKNNDHDISSSQVPMPRHVVAISARWGSIRVENEFSYL